MGFFQLSLSLPLLLSFGFLVPEALSFGRAANFAPTLKSRRSATNWWSQKQIFWRESKEEKKRPIWILAGDSISAGWANNSSLGDRYQTAMDKELPLPNTIKDLLMHFPSFSKAWYTGTENNFGVMGFLDPRWAREQRENSSKRAPNWAVIGTAFSGATLMPEILDEMGVNLQTFGRGHNPEQAGFLDHDTVELIEGVQQRERVRLVSMSIGSNDLCGGLDPFVHESKIRAKLRKLKGLFEPGQVKFAVWKVPELDELHAGITQGLRSLPNESRREQKARERVVSYCQDAWEAYCPATEDPARLGANVKKLNQILRSEMGPLFDAGLRFERPGDASEVLTLVSRDCFHPSAHAQTLVTARIIDHIRSL